MIENHGLSTRVVTANAQGIAEAAAVLRRGGLVAFPTETVYGLGADAENASAVQAMFAAKGRPADHPVIVHQADAAMVDSFATDVPQDARLLAKAFWPGPMTLVLRRSERISDLVTGGLDTVGLRVPAHPVAQALLREFGGPVAAPSANRFGRVSATRAEHVLEELGGRVDLILDGGESDVGLESTIVDLSSGQVRVLRPGAVTREEVEEVLGKSVVGQGSDAPRVSGSLPSHYAPRARVEIVNPAELDARAAACTGCGKRVAIWASGIEGNLPSDCVLLEAPVDHQTLAHELYALLRRVDELQCDVLLVTLPSEHGLGAAIADRLRRAAGPR